MRPTLPRPLDPRRPPQHRPRWLFAGLRAFAPERIRLRCDQEVAVAAGLPVIDSRMVPFERAAKLAVSGPLVAVNEPPSPRPWHGLSYAPLQAVAAAYRKAGAEVCNIPEHPEHDGI